jgi:glycerophosphoryl diester phosphodiesterase
VAAHRGAASVAPEETLPAIVAAVKQGADYVDFDVRWTRSSVAVLMHDETVDRTTNGTGYVSSLYLSQLQALDAGSHFSPVYAGEKVPTLGAALRAMAPDPDVVALPELKGYVDAGKLGVYADAVSGHGMTGRVLTDPVASVRAAQATYWLPKASTLTAESVAAAQAAGITVIPWGTEDQASWEHLADLGVDALLTDRPGLYAGWRLSRCDY